MEIRKLEKGVYQLQLSTSKFIKEGRGEKKRMSDSEVGRDGKCITYKRCRFAFSTFNWILKIQETRCPTSLSVFFFFFLSWNVTIFFIGLIIY